LTLPLFNQNQGQIAQARAQRELAAARFVALQARDIAQTERALADYRAALVTLDAAKSLAATQQSSTQSAQRQFASGYIDRSTLDQARLQALAAENTRLSTSIQAQQALGALEDAVERPLDGSVEISALPDTRRDAPANRESWP
jgi:cobalt-zinc-cadmium efflux system outer membrane protein